MGRFAHGHLKTPHDPQLGDGRIDLLVDYSDEVSRTQGLVSELGMSSVGWPHTGFLGRHSGFTHITREVWLVFLPSHFGQGVGD